jgi:hypothetical protein
MSSTVGRFTNKTIELLRISTGTLCSNPSCRRNTIFYNRESETLVQIGQAAHIKGRLSGSPRHDPMQKKEDCQHFNNGIWLCNNCARLVDVDANSYSVDLLIQWKKQAEDDIKNKIIQGTYPSIVENLIDLDVPEVEEMCIALKKNKYYKVEKKPTANIIKKIMELNGVPSASDLDTIYGKKLPYVVLYPNSKTWESFIIIEREFLKTLKIEKKEKLIRFPEIKWNTVSELNELLL